MFAVSVKDIVCLFLPVPLPLVFLRVWLSTNVWSLSHSCCSDNWRHWRHHCASSLLGTGAPLRSSWLVTVPSAEVVVAAIDKIEDELTSCCSPARAPCHHCCVRFASGCVPTSANICSVDAVPSLCCFCCCCCFVVVNSWSLQRIMYMKIITEHLNRCVACNDIKRSFS